jgi:hypothetical protein
MLSNSFKFWRLQKDKMKGHEIILQMKDSTIIEFKAIQYQ